jgi:amino acid transporter
LGITGFETSSNYIEEQKPGVFPKTMNNMWWLVLIFNPTISLLSLGVLPVQTFIDSPNNILSLVGGVGAGYFVLHDLIKTGRGFRIWMAIDACIVLCGGVLTAYIGIVGLLERMAADRCLPGFLVQRNRFFHTSHFVILGFFLLTASLYAIVNGNLTTLGGVFAGNQSNSLD